MVSPPTREDAQLMATLVLAAATCFAYIIWGIARHRVQTSGLRHWLRK